MDMNWLALLDQQMEEYSSLLREKIGLQSQDSRELASAIHRQLRGDADLLMKLRNASPLDPRQRRLYFEHYQLWVWHTRDFRIEPMPEFANDKNFTQRVSDAQTYMQITLDLYASFVFPGDNLFEVLACSGQPESTIRRCAVFVRKDPVRAIRNAVAHGNWQLEPDGSFTYYARSNRGSDAQLEPYSAGPDDMTFYMSLTRCLCWSALHAMEQDE